MHLTITEKPERKLKDVTVIFAYAAQLFMELTRPEQLRIIRIMEHLSKEQGGKRT